MTRPTMRDVAVLAQVSHKTVSRVVNGEPGVSEALARRVRKASEQLGYRHNLAASNLRSGQRTRSVALLVQDLSNDYSAALLRAVDDTARDRGVAVLSASLDEEGARERELVTNLIGRRVDGLILMPATHSQAYLQPDLSAGFAVVMIDRKPNGVSTDHVLVDNIAGARTATDHLLAHGHTRVALISDDLRITTAADRRTGWAQALVAAGLSPDEALVRTARTVSAATEAVLELLDLDDPPTAVFAARNTSAVGAVVALRRAGRQDTVALVGFDEVRLSELVEPGITTVEQHPDRIGRLAAQLLLDRLDDPQAPHRSHVLPTTLVPRGSGEIRRHPGAPPGA